MSLEQKIKSLEPCQEAMEWLQEFKDGEEQTAWEKCERGDWMLWLLGRLSGPPDIKSRKRLVKVANACAKLATPMENPEHEKIRLMCLKTTDDYVNGTATLEDVRVADKAAYAAAYAAYADAAYADAADAYADADAAYAAAYAADADAADADAAYDAASAAASAAASSSAADARIKILKQCADLCRIEYPNAPI